MRRKVQIIPRRTLLVACSALAIAIIGIMLLLILARDDTKTNATAKVITHSTNSPDEKRPSNEYVWEGAANDPKKISIPNLGIDSYIQNVGIDQNREIAVPTSIHFAGWFVDSVRPGDKGLSIIDGHLNGRQEDGIFTKLDKLQVGELLKIEFGNGSSRTFIVKAVETVDLDKAASVLYSQSPGIKNQLNLITCSGTYDKNARLYDKRVIVTSELKK